MKQAVIVYASTHHGNTRKLVDAISRKFGVSGIDATEVSGMDLNGFDLIGFASGIDFGRFYQPVERFLEENLPEGKQVFFLYTCARPDSRFTRRMREAALEKGAVILGEYGCRGYNTYGPWKLVGGMNRNHPSREELQAAEDFFASLLKVKM